MNKKLEDLIKLKAKYEKKISEVGKDGLGESFAEFFDAFPDIAAVQWDQFAPHFNDGEPCVFSVYDPTISFEDEPDEFCDQWDCGHRQLEIDPKMWDHLNGIFDVPEEVMKSVFGDDSRITATRDGFKVEEGFDHD